MARLIIRVKHCVYDATEFGSDDQVIVSRVFYDLSINGMKRGEFYSDLTQRVGSSPNPTSVEVTRPYGYSGPFDHAVFSQKLIACYQEMVSRSIGLPSTSGIVVPRRLNHRLVIPAEFEVQTTEPVPNIGRSASSG